jgi:pimeloyl-ACP methyl ester carboxylesterase/TM2 domain-containing membrane protein YozV
VSKFEKAIFLGYSAFRILFYFQLEEKMPPTTDTKKRKPVLSVFLSLISMGLGQVYNGELLRGIILKVALLFSLCLFAIAVFKSPKELFLWIAVIVFFLLLKLYSLFQAFSASRRLGTNYTLKKFNKSYFYVLITFLFLVLNVASPLLIAKFSLREMTPYHPFRSAGAKQHYLTFYDGIARDWPVDSEERMIKTSHGNTYVRISGPIEAPPLVLMHGAGATSLSWMPNIKALSQSYRTYAVDNIYDFGRSVFTKIFKVPDDFVGWMDELFTALDLGDNINLMGLSYGGWLTSQYAVKHPERLDKIVLLAPAATVLPLGPGFLGPALLSILPHRHFVKKGMETILADLWKKDEAGREYAEYWVDHVDLSFRSFKPKMTVSPTVLTDEELRSLKMPVLFLVGENEKIYSPHKAAERLKSIAPQIITEIIPGAGHDLSVVQADMVNQKILDFLEKTETPTFPLQ